MIHRVDQALRVRWLSRAASPIAEVALTDLLLPIRRSFVSTAVQMRSAPLVTFGHIGLHYDDEELFISNRKM